MKKLVLSFLAFVLPITLFSGCAALPTLIVPTTVPTLAPTKLPKESINILVVPFYSSDGTQIHVGDYSDRLRTNDLNQLAGLAQEMAQQDIFSRNGRVGLQLKRPVAVRILQAPQGFRRVGHAGIDAPQQISETPFTGCHQSATAHT